MCAGRLIRGNQTEDDDVAAAAAEVRLTPFHPPTHTSNPHPHLLLLAH